MNQRVNAPFLWIALDGLAEDPRGTLQTMRRLDEVPGHFGFKVNLDFITEVGARNAAVHLPQGRRKFADIKMWNGARTMARTFSIIGAAGFDVVNAYALAGGYEDDKGKGAELKRAIATFRKSARGHPKLKVYVLTVLSHYADHYCLRHFGRRMDREVGDRAAEGVAAGADGLILPGTMLRHVDHHPVRKILTGMRTDWYQDNEQEQQIRPEDVAGRVDLEVVCGSPIMKTSDPVAGLKRLLAALQG